MGLASVTSRVLSVGCQRERLTCIDLVLERQVFRGLFGAMVRGNGCPSGRCVRRAVLRLGMYGNKTAMRQHTSDILS